MRRPEIALRHCKAGDRRKCSLVCLDRDEGAAGTVRINRWGGSLPLRTHWSRAKRSPRIVQHRTRGARHRVAFDRGGKGEIVGRVDVILEHAEVPGRHGEAIVEATLAAAGDMYEGAIENGLACLAHVKPPEHHRSEER